MTRDAAVPLVAPGAAASAEDRLEFVAAQLESLCGAPLPICGGLTLKQGMHSRTQGGVPLTRTPTTARYPKL